MITIYQISLTNDQVNAVNAANDFGAVPAADAMVRMQLGAKKWRSEYSRYYTPMFEVDTDDLDIAFELTNLWNNGHLVRALPGTRGRSSSVGDIFVLDSGEAYIVDCFGFEQIGDFVIDIRPESM
jgi:hypothetical protein